MVTMRSAHEPIVVGVDGSQAALDAVRWAALESRRRNIGVRLVDAAGPMPPPGPGDPRVGAPYRDALRDEADQAVATAAAVAELSAPGTEVVTEVLIGEPIPILLAESGHAQLVVLGDRGAGGFAALMVGSVAVALAAHAKCPVIVVRGSRPSGSDRGGPVPAEGPVVVGVDGSAESEAALAFAYEAAATRQVPLVAVHAWQDAVVGVAMSPLVNWAAVEAAEHAILAERLAGWGEKFPDVLVRRVVAFDRPAHTLLEQSAGAQLVVVGSRGRGAFTGLVLGSVSQALLHHATCPVAVVRPAGVGG